eukprot:tig00000654_g2817.t1
MGLTAVELLAELRNVSFVNAQLVTDRQRVRKGADVAGELVRVASSAPLLLSDFANLGFSDTYAVVNQTTYIASNVTGNVTFAARAVSVGEGASFSVQYSSSVIGGGGSVPGTPLLDVVDVSSMTCDKTRVGVNRSIQCEVFKADGSPQLRRDDFRDPYFNQISELTVVTATGLMFPYQPAVVNG